MKLYFFFFSIFYFVKSDQMDDIFNQLLNNSTANSNNNLLDSSNPLVAGLMKELVKEKIFSSIQNLIDELKKSDKYTGVNIEFIDNMAKNLNVMKNDLDLAKLLDIINNFKSVIESQDSEEKERMMNMIKIIERIVKVFLKKAKEGFNSIENKIEENSEKIQDNIESNIEKYEKTKDKENNSNNLNKLDEIINKKTEDDSKITTYVIVFLSVVSIIAITLLICVLVSISRKRVKNSDIEFVRANEESFDSRTGRPREIL